MSPCDSQSKMPSETGLNTETASNGTEKQLCLGCLCPNDPAAHFCSDCGAPLSSYAATAPFERIFAEGHVYRKAVGEPRNLIVVLGIWLIFGLTASAGVIFLLNFGSTGIASVLFSGFLIAISVAMIWKSTRSFLKKPQHQPSSDA